MFSFFIVVQNEFGIDQMLLWCYYITRTKLNFFSTFESSSTIRKFPAVLHVPSSFHIVSPGFDSRQPEVTENGLEKSGLVHFLLFFIIKMNKVITPLFALISF